MTTDPTSSSSAQAGAAIYTKPVLALYDLAVVHLSNQFVWQCPASTILGFYNRHITGNHLDVGVGTGYYLDNCRMPTPAPRLALMDLNPNSLEVTAKRLQRYHPSSHVANVLESIAWDVPKFDSIGLNYVLHCLPGTMQSKQVVFQNLLPLLDRGGVVFGSTILGQKVRHNAIGRTLMNIYNNKGVFGNREDNLQDLEISLKQHFQDVATHIVGCVAFFAAWV